MEPVSLEHVIGGGIIAAGLGTFAGLVMTIIFVLRAQ
jgi:hypothetical protein